MTLSIPAPATLAALLGLIDDDGARKLEARAKILTPWNAMMPALSSWWLGGRVCYRLADDLMSALLLTDIDGVDVLPPHESFFISLSGQVDFKLGGAPVDGVYLALVEHPRHGRQGVFVASAQYGGKNAPYYSWSFLDPALNDDAAEGVDRSLMLDMLGIVLRVAYYLMDPEHEEAPESVHANAEWRRQMRAAGTKAPDEALLGLRTRVLGETYRLPSDASDLDASGRSLGLRHPVRGHIRMQPVGEGRSARRATWVRPHWRGSGVSSTQVVSVVQPKSSAGPSASERSERVHEAMKHYRERIAKGFR